MTENALAAIVLAVLGIVCIFFSAAFAIEELKDGAFQEGASQGIRMRQKFDEQQDDCDPAGGPTHPTYLDPKQPVDIIMQNFFYRIHGDES